MFRLGYDRAKKQKSIKKEIPPILLTLVYEHTNAHEESME